MEKVWTWIVIQEDLFQVRQVGRISRLVRAAVDFSWAVHGLNFFGL